MTTHLQLLPILVLFGVLIKLSDENISLELANTELEDTLAKKKDELMRVRNDLLSAQKAVIKKDSLFQETNSLLLEHISKTSSESKQNEAIGGDKGLEKAECIYKGKKGPRGTLYSSRYIACDDLIVCGYYPDEPKWAFVRYMYGIISKDLKAPYYENIRFSYILPEKIPSVRSFSPERSTAIIFEDVCVAPESIQNRIIPFFTYRHHRNISSIYVIQRYHHTSIIICENILHLVVFNGGSSHQDISKVIGRYTEDMKNTSMVVNNDDLLAIWLRFDTPLDLQKENHLFAMKKLTINDVYAIAGKRDGHEWTTSLNNIKNGKTWCPYCANKASHTIEDAKQVAFSKNRKCLSETYDNSFSHLSWRYSEGHEWNASFNNVKNNKTWCPYCANNRPCTLDDAKQLAYNRNGACLSEYYINNRSALLWMCDKKHRWFATFDNVKHLNSIDIYYPEYGFAIEVQHEKYIKFFHNGNPNNFIKQQARDQLKKELCKENQIALRYVWYYEDPHIVIPEHLRKLGLI
ncbi:hypothetical protein RhiirC2_854623 [Rhizophagus irregularis]|uniref:Zinc-ribbon domain-containing protein n=1 Tax=Rhizophagus irregularis TaxID=588596 RepID=A0A2N1MQV1_9GLOM|nr:hypothetical protein RhiirC2_854623 [Rhizophagus irregularis]